jgi:hypothetical protein
MKYTDLLKDASVIVRGKLLWKRFIDGTPLSNDLPFWMADFAAAAAAHERETCAKVCEDLDAWNMDDPASTAVTAIRARGEA